jgi:hypothetical protein
MMINNGRQSRGKQGRNPRRNELNCCMELGMLWG